MFNFLLIEYFKLYLMYPYSLPFLNKVGMQSVV